MRRVPAFVWILAPLAIGLLYAAGHALLAPTPRPADLPPEEAILVHRMRGLDMLDLTSPGPRGPTQRAPREPLGVERNNASLLGVDHEAWVHLVIMPRTLGLDSTMAIFRLKDKGAFEREFMRTDFLERGLIRQAQHLTIQGDYAAVGPNRDATRRLGTGGITCEDLGEDWSMAAHLPQLVDHAVQLAKQYPWRGVLTALGIDVDAARMQLDPTENVIKAFLPGDQRLQRVRDGWKTVRLWAWHNDRKLRVDLEPAAGTELAKLLADRAAVVEPPPVAPPAPPSAQAWLRVPSGVRRAALARVLLACGVRFVPPSDDESVDPLGGLGAQGKGGLIVWAEAGVGTGYAMTVGIAAATGQLPDLSAFLPTPAAGARSVALPEGVAPITVGDTTTDRKVPAGTVEARTPTQGDILAFGPSAKQAAEGMVAFLVTEPPTTGVGGDVLATFFLSQRRAEKVLGRALQPGGFLAMLADGDIHGRVEFVDGVVRLTAWVKR